MATNSKIKWIETGYELFATDGADGIQVERLARILHLNKSGFYHYFHTHDNFLVELFLHHRNIASQMAAETKQCKALDPDYFRLLEKYKLCVLVQGELARKANHTLYYNVLCEVREITDCYLLPLWSKSFNLPDDPQLVFRHLTLFRNAFHAQANIDNITYDMLHTTMTEIGTMIHEVLAHARWGEQNLRAYEMMFVNTKQG